MRSNVKESFNSCMYAIIFIGLSVCLTACPEGPMEENSIKFYNNSSSDIYIFFGYPRDEYGEPVFPDTMITSERRLTSLIRKNGGFVYYEYRHFEGQPNIYHLYVFDTDTVNKYSWDEIREGYKILKRYDLNIENGLKEFKGVITYPPSEALKDVPMYPPYQ